MTKTFTSRLAFAIHGIALILLILEVHSKMPTPPSVIVYSGILNSVALVFYGINVK